MSLALHPPARIPHVVMIPQAAFAALPLALLLECVRDKGAALCIPVRSLGAIINVVVCEIVGVVHQAAPLPRYAWL